MNGILRTKRTAVHIYTQIIMCVAVCILFLLACSALCEVINIMCSTGRATQGVWVRRPQSVVPVAK